MIKTEPDHRLAFINISTTESRIFSINVIDDSDDYNDLVFEWSYSLNEGDFEFYSRGNEVAINGREFAIGDIINLKVDISDTFENTTTVIWRILIVL